MQVNCNTTLHDSKCHSSVVGDLTTLSRCARKLLQFYAHLVCLGFEISDYSLREIANRIGYADISSVSSGFSELEAHNLMGSQHRGNNNKLRWITCDGFKLSSLKLPNQIKSILNISLSSYKKLRFKILKGVETVDNSQALSADTKKMKEVIKNVLKIPDKFYQRSQIIHALTHSGLAIGDILTLTHRVVAANAKNRIKSPRAYFLKAIQNQLLQTGVTQYV